MADSCLQDHFVSEVNRLLEAVDTTSTPGTLYVGYSGGNDSTALAHLCLQCLDRLPFQQLHLVHINHGHHEHADQWADHCVKFAEDWGLPITVEKVRGHTIGNLEAFWRGERYRIWEATLAAGDWLFTAHHAEDNTETLLLRLQRRSGVNGMRGIRPSRPLGSGHIGRPLLTISRANLVAYCERQNLQVLEDPSNVDPTYDRAFVRQNIVPELVQRWPHFAENASRTALQVHEDAELLAKFGQQLLAGCQLLSPNTLSVSAFQKLQEPEQRLVLRTWLSFQGRELPEQKVLAQIQQQAAKVQANSVVAWGNTEVRGYRDILWVGDPIETPDPDWLQPLQAGSISLPASCGKLTVEAPAELLKAQAADALKIRFRQDGDRLPAAGGRPGKLLKVWFQEQSVPPWLRGRVPFLVKDDTIHAIADWWLSDQMEKWIEQGLDIQWQTTVDPSSGVR